jgi:hypothetical protein
MWPLFMSTRESLTIISQTYLDYTRAGANLEVSAPNRGAGRRSAWVADRDGPFGRRSVDEHRIRLRGGWECQFLDVAGEVPERVTLPIRWPRHISGRVRLSRRFGRPHLDAARQIVLLELDRVEGIESLFLNGEVLAVTDPARSSYEIALGELLERNLLVLEIETAGAGGKSASDDGDWGQIALVIRRIEPVAGL